MVQSFSGTHEFHPTVWADPDVGLEDPGQADLLTDLIESGRCPRCEGPLSPLPHWLPAGSRLTRCRSIPICGPCGTDEVYEQLDAATGIGWGLSWADMWPIAHEEIEERRTRRMSQTKPAILAGDGRLIAEDGSPQIVDPRNTGGWAQYGGHE